MADDKRISELPLATTPLAGTEELEIVQGGVNKRVASSNLGGGGSVTSVTGDGVDNTDPANPVVSGVTREFNRAFTPTLLFDKNYIEGSLHVQTAAIEFTHALSGNLVDQESVYGQRVLTDGVSPITFLDFNHIANIASGDILDAGTYQFIFWYSNGIARASVMLPSEEVATLTPLTAATNFMAVPDAVNGDTELDLSWDEILNADSLELDFSTAGGGGPWTSLATLAGNAVSYSHTGLTAASTYHYRIRGIGSTPYSNSPYSITAQTTEDPGDVTAPVTSFSISDTATGIPVNRSLFVTWDEPVRNLDTTEITNANADVVIVVREDNGAGAIIPCTFVVNAEKTQVEVIPDVIWGDTQLVHVTVDDIEDVNGNAIASPEILTFTSSDFTEMNGTANMSLMGNPLNAVFGAVDAIFKLKFTITNMLVEGNRMFWAKYSKDDNSRTFFWASSGSNVDFIYYPVVGDNTRKRRITWTGVLDNLEHDFELWYNGGLDTNDGLDRGRLWKDGVEQTSKSITEAAGALGELFVGSALLTFGNAANNAGSPTTTAWLAGEVKDLVVTSGAGDTVEVNIPIVRTGIDISGNGRHGTWF